MDASIQPYSTSNPIVRRPTLWCRNGVHALSCVHVCVLISASLTWDPCTVVYRYGRRAVALVLRRFAFSRRGASLAFSCYGLARARAFACVALALPRSDVASPCRRRYVALTSLPAFAGTWRHIASPINSSFAHPGVHCCTSVCQGESIRWPMAALPGSSDRDDSTCISISDHLVSHNTFIAPIGGANVIPNNSYYDGLYSGMRPCPPHPWWWRRSNTPSIGSWNYFRLATTFHLHSQYWFLELFSSRDNKSSPDGAGLSVRFTTLKYLSMAIFASRNIQLNQI